MSNIIRRTSPLVLLCLAALGAATLLPARSQRLDTSTQSGPAQGMPTQGGPNQDGPAQGIPSQDGTALAQLDLQVTLPAAAELPRFSHYSNTSHRMLKPRRGQPPTVSSNLFAIRKVDGLILMVDIGATATPAEAQELAHNAMNTPSGDLPHGTLSGHSIGQDVWQTLPQGQVPAGGTYQLIAHDGCTLVGVKLMAPLQGYKNGRPVQSVLPLEDIQMAEDIAAACLARSGYLGLTSRPALDASAKRRFLTQRMALMHPAKRPATQTARK